MINANTISFSKEFQTWSCHQLKSVISIQDPSQAPLCAKQEASDLQTRSAIKFSSILFPGKVSI